MDRSSKRLQELDSFAEPHNSVGAVSLHADSRLKCAWRVVISMSISIGEKRVQAQRPGALQNLRALDRRHHGVILGYAVDTLPSPMHWAAAAHAAPVRFIPGTHS